MVKHSSDAITLGLPLVQKETRCNNISMATVEYTVYYGIINDDGTSNCTSTVKSCSQVVIESIMEILDQYYNEN